MLHAVRLSPEERDRCAHEFSQVGYEPLPRYHVLVVLELRRVRVNHKSLVDVPLLVRNRGLNHLHHLQLLSHIPDSLAHRINFPRAMLLHRIKIPRRLLMVN